MKDINVKNPLEFPQIYSKIVRLLTLYVPPQEHVRGNLGIWFYTTLKSRGFDDLGIEISEEKSIETWYKQTVDDVVRTVEQALLNKNHVADHQLVI